MVRTSTHQLKRRDVLRTTAGGVASAAAILTFGGTVTADDGTQRFLVETRGNASARIEDAGIQIVRELASGDVLSVDGHESNEDALAANPGVINVVANARLDLDILDDRPNELTQATIQGNNDELPTFFDRLWGMERIDALDAHETATGDGARVAVVDTGIHPDHVDLVGNVDEAHSLAFTQGDRIEEDEPQDIHGHGTAVSGPLAARGANAVLGVAPDADLVSIRIFRVIDHVDGVPIIATTTEDVLLAFDHVASIDVAAMNFSVGIIPLHPSFNAGGFRGITERLANEIVRSGTLFAASTGNEGMDTQRGPLVNFYTDLAGVVGCGGTGPLDERSYYSDYGVPTVGVAAPAGGHDEFIKSFCGFHEWVAAVLSAEDPDEFEEAFFDAHVEPGDETRVCLGEDGLPVLDPDPDPEDDHVAECIDCTAPEYPDPLHLFLTPVFNPALSDVDDSYGWVAGTSLAAPIVAGIAALVAEVDPDLHPRGVERAIKNGAELVDGESSPELGAGRVNAANTVKEVGEVSPSDSASLVFCVS